MLKDTRVTQEEHIILPSKQKHSSNVWTIEKEKKQAGAELSQAWMSLDQIMLCQIQLS